MPVVCYCIMSFYFPSLLLGRRLPQVPTAKDPINAHLHTLNSATQILGRARYMAGLRCLLNAVEDPALNRNVVLALLDLVISLLAPHRPQMLSRTESVFESSVQSPMHACPSPES